MATIEKRNCENCKYWNPLKPGILYSAVQQHVTEAEIGKDYLPDNWGKCMNEKFKAVSASHVERALPLPLATFLFKLCTFEDGGAAYILATHKTYGCPYFLEK